MRLSHQSGLTSITLSSVVIDHLVSLCVAEILVCKSSGWNSGQYYNFMTSVLIPEIVISKPECLPDPKNCAVVLLCVLVASYI